MYEQIHIPTPTLRVGNAIVQPLAQQQRDQTDALVAVIHVIPILIGKHASTVGQCLLLITIATVMHTEKISGFKNVSMTALR